MSCSASSSWRTSARACSSAATACGISCIPIAWADIAAISVVPARRWIGEAAGFLRSPAHVAAFCAAIQLLLRLRRDFPYFRTNEEVHHRGRQFRGVSCS
jgi:hypothetical protein